MSRSHKKNPVCGMTKKDSDKQDKRIANRRLRTNVNIAIKQEKEVMPELKEVSNVWDMNKDGKQRFDPKQHPKDMRK